ncbi:hypothetical protein U1Q18_033003, partial [Sarracenia purpurea var. burkii]
AVDVGEQPRLKGVEERSPRREGDPEAEAFDRGVGVRRIHGDEWRRIFFFYKPQVCGFDTMKKLRRENDCVFSIY